MQLKPRNNRDRDSLDAGARSSLRPSVFWRLVEDIPRPLNWILSGISIGLPLILWWGITTFGSIDSKFLPSPAAVVSAFQRLWATGELQQDTIASLWRVGVGFFFSALFV